ncbi:MAG: hypothetical protein ACR2M1_17245, partial [Gemmatimonadaceae bacterium]
GSPAMAATAAVANSYKQECYDGIHAAADVYKIALYVAANATLSAATTAYTVTGEVTGTGYTAGGLTLAGRASGLSTNTAYETWTSPQWTSATITADTAVIYNSSKANRIVCVLTFASTSSTNGTFTVNLPAAGATATVTNT